MRLLLAPMDGLTDPLMRDLLTSMGGFDYAATEFVRVTQRVLPDHVFYRYSPELKTKGRTRAGVPVYIQILGGDPGLMAENAAKACELGAPGIDINFGCPAKKVNSHDGGSVILKEPNRVFAIGSAVRKAVPSHIPVTIKIRLGYEDTSLAVENALAAEQAGAEWLSVHARTKVQGYKPPANWQKLAEINDQLKIPVIANGDIWSVDDWRRCREVSGCSDFMLGRGAVANPFLASSIRSNEMSPVQKWQDLQPLWTRFFATSPSEQYVTGRAKQWLKLLCESYPEAKGVFESSKRLKDRTLLSQSIFSSFA